MAMQEFRKAADGGNCVAMMAIGNYNSYGSTKSCTVYNTSYDDSVLQAYRQYASAAGYAAHAY